MLAPPQLPANGARVTIPSAILSTDDSQVPDTSPGRFAPAMATPVRRDDLDALRGGAMLLGIVLHASLAYFPYPWPVQDSRQDGLFSLIYALIHGFRMPLFFLLSGFFTTLVLRRRGVKALLVGRGLRIVLPLVVAWLTILPLTRMAIEVAVRQTVAATERRSPLAGSILAGDREGVRRILAATEPGVPGRDDTTGITPLTLAAMGGDGEIVAMLLEAGADLDATDRDGSTALHAAAFMGQADIVRLLLDRGANAAARNSAGKIPRDALSVPAEIAASVAGFLGLAARSEVDIDLGREAAAGMLAARSPPSAPGGVFASAAAAYHSALASSRWRVEFAGRSWHLVQTDVFEHLWFLWYLCWLVAAVALAESVGIGPSGRRRFWLVPASCLPFALMWSPFGPDTDLGLMPLPHLLLFYACFFWFGAGTYASEGLEATLGRPWKLMLPLSLLVIFPAAIATIGKPFLAAILQPAYAWGMSLGLIGLFHRWLSRPSAAFAWLADASYWMYLAHLPLVIVAQSFCHDLAWPAPVKFLAVIAFTIVILLVTYRLFVRFTPIGWLLNGPRPRRGPADRS
jgi:peptidoglycan/LPS O-acetylase OafA/YrhL